MFVLSATSTLAQEPTQPPVQLVPRSERKHDHSPQSSVKVKNERSSPDMLLRREQEEHCRIRVLTTALICPGMRLQNHTWSACVK
jgi:hypothetical protein